jgi:hypothetical protein
VSSSSWPAGDAQDVRIGREQRRGPERKSVTRLDEEPNSLDLRQGVPAAVAATGDKRPERGVGEASPPTTAAISSSSSTLNPSLRVFDGLEDRPGH